MKKKIKKIEVSQETPQVESKVESGVESEKEKLLNLYQILKDLGIRSISDLENLIAKAE